MTSAEFGVWKYLFEKHGWGFGREDLRTQRICTTIANFSGRLDKDHFTKPSNFPIADV